MKKSLKKLSVMITLLIVFNSVPVFAEINLNKSTEIEISQDNIFRPEIETFSTEKETKVPNKFTLYGNADENQVIIKIGNIGIDSLDSVSLSIKEGTRTVSKFVGKVLPGSKEVRVPFLMKKSVEHMTVTCTIVDAGQTVIKTLNVSRSVPAKALNRWHRGSFPTQIASLDSHYAKHGSQVGASNIIQYLNKADGFSQNLRGSHISNVPGSVPGVKRYRKLGKYIDIAPNKQIISFGT